MADDFLHTQATALSLLYSQYEWEGITHPWGSAFSVNPDLPLLRTWDGASGSQPSESGRMLTRLPRGRLDTSRARKTKNKRGNQTIAVLNPNVRIDKGLPVLNMVDEMRYYGVPDPYGRANNYYKNHYICLWELLKADCWYEQVILPASKEHNDRYNAHNKAFKSAVRLKNMELALGTNLTPLMKLKKTTQWMTR
ncbi:hypothetical protein BDQ94DRAFT_164417 [Aspergillus welwitschiae]|uniref:Uncharacterized protein n=1 Tax=Aspergillus welwitschiae TaxID=1341132 RepID=A0A3F3PHW6_9EURO|nr:hypothetical protein BDQ94DRAFT_164417 [Aspergillus welwitschiae]RDH26519.1 hypothetical protein BDQ94DRAFT_164417 [Aspergillus welwitschiae]